MAGRKDTSEPHGRHTNERVAPSPMAGGSSSTAAGRYPPDVTETWRTLVLFYPVLDAKLGSGLARRRARRVMGREERAAIESVVETLPATVSAWSEGAATLDPFDVVVVRRPIGSMSSSGGGRWWVGPREVRPELEAVTATGATLRLRHRPLAGRPGHPAMRLGLHAGTVRRDVRRRLQLDLDGPLALARHRPRSGAGVRPRVAAPGGGGLPGARPGRGGAAAPPRRGRVRLDAACRRAAVRAIVRRLSRRGRWAAGGSDVVAVVSRLDDGRDRGDTRMATDRAGVATGDASVATGGASRRGNAPIGLTPDRWALRGRADRTGILGA